MQTKKTKSKYNVESCGLVMEASKILNLRMPEILLAVMDKAT